VRVREYILIGMFLSAIFGPDLSAAHHLHGFHRTCFISARIEATVGRLPLDWTTTTQVAFLQF